MTVLKQKKCIVRAHVGLQCCDVGLHHTQTNFYVPCQTQGQPAINPINTFCLQHFFL